VRAFVDALGRLNQQVAAACDRVTLDGGRLAADAERQGMNRLVAALLLCLAFSAQALQITDDRGVTRHAARQPAAHRHLLPSLTETVCELGQCHRIIGVDRYSNYPAHVRTLPQVGGGVDPNIEAVVALKPDVVLMATSSRGVQRLESLGLKVLALEPRSAADAQRVMGKLGQLLEVADALRIWRNIDAGRVGGGEVAAAISAQPACVLRGQPGGYAAGPTSFIGETMARLGVQNIVTPDLGPYPKSTPNLWCAPTPTSS
jgi:iron complex transport system substrate-binding protein